MVKQYSCSVGIMQPYFFPYWGHFSLIAHTDRWLIFDDCQYMPKSWMNRNRILHPKEGWQYVTVSLSNSSRNIITSKARIFDLESSRLKIKNQLGHYKKSAPYFDEVISLVEKAFELVDSSNSLVSLCHGSLKVTCDYLNIPLQAQCTSELDLHYPKGLSGGKWAPFICHEIGAIDYLNPDSGAHLFDIEDFQRLNTGFYTLSPCEFKYKQVGYKFSPNLSILDTAMWLSPEEIKATIENNVLITRKI